VKRIQSIEDLRPDPDNANQGTERGRGMLEQSLREFGAGRSVVSDKHGTMIAGSKTLEVAADIGLPIRPVHTDGSELVVVVRDDLDLTDGDKARRLAYADNRTGQVGLDWDAAQILADLEAEVDLSGLWTDDEITELVAGAIEEPPEDAGPQIDRAEELRETWGVERGQIWEVPSKSVKGKCHRVMCGDSTSEEDVVPLMGGKRAQAVVTDPPYGQNQMGVSHDEPGKLRAMVRGAVACLPCSNAIVVAFQSPRTFPEWLDAVRDGDHHFERMLWLYKTAQCTFPWRGWLLTSEAILISSVGMASWQDIHPYSHDCYQLAEVSGELSDSAGWHGSIKPLSVVSDLLRRVCVPGALTFDGFLGSGTTMVAAEQLGRLCYGMEIAEKYVAVTLQRLADMGLEPRLVEAQ